MGGRAGQWHIPSLNVCLVFGSFGPEPWCFGIEHIGKDDHGIWMLGEPVGQLAESEAGVFHACLFPDDQERH